MNPTDKKEEVLKEIPFLPGNDTWGGKVQIVRVTLPQENGPSRTFINKRLMFNANNRYINLPRHGIEEVVQAILAASESEREHHEALIAQLNANRPAHCGGPPKQTFDQPRRGNDRRRGRDDKGDWR
jgi:hypothetical protein